MNLLKIRSSRAKISTNKICYLFEFERNVFLFLFRGDKAKTYNTPKISTPVRWGACLIRFAFLGLLACFPRQTIRKVDHAASEWTRAGAFLPAHSIYLQSVYKISISSDHFRCRWMTTRNWQHQQTCCKEANELGTL